MHWTFGSIVAGFDNVEPKCWVKRAIDEMCGDRSKCCISNCAECAEIANRALPLECGPVLRGIRQHSKCASVVGTK